MKRLNEILREREPYWVSPRMNVQQAVVYLCEHKIGAALVKSGDDVVGVFSERDLLHRVVNRNLCPSKMLVEEIMSRNPIKIRINDDMLIAKAIMHMYKVRHLMVVDEDAAVMGLISMRDIMEQDLASSEDMLRKLNDTYYEKAYRPKWRISSNRVIVEPYVPKE